MSIPSLARSCHHPTCDWDCETRLAVIAMIVWRWLAHLCGRNCASGRDSAIAARSRADQSASLAQPTRPRWR
eukprot:4974412-Pyramimonas_sp.AAC.1